MRLGYMWFGEGGGIGDWGGGNEARSLAPHIVVGEGDCEDRRAPSVMRVEKWGGGDLAPH